MLEPEQPQLFTAIPVDAEGRAIQGLTAEWESSDNRIVTVSPHGEALAVRPGAARLTARAGNQRAVVGVLVRRGSGEKFGGKKQGPVRTPQARRRETSAPNASFIPASGTRSRFSITRARFEPAAKASSLATPLFLRAPEDDPLPDGDTETLYHPANEVGTPPGKTEPGAATPPAAASGAETPGSANFSLSVPVAGLSGRGLGVSLALNYNSRLWHKSGSKLTYDVDSGWPAPGFRLGYGQMEDQGSSGFTLTDPNGTRHEMARTGSASSSDYDSTDGTFIHFHGGRGWGTATYTDGTRIEYGAAGTGYRSYPVKIVDRNGNFISVSYVDGIGPRISSITDTLGRYVRFYYENNELVSVTTPRLAGTAGEETTTIRLYYGTIDLSEVTLQSLFDTSLVTPQAPSTARVIRYIHFPGSRSGYRYDYSPYGMIRQVVQLREMQIANFNFDPLTAVNNDGQWGASTLYSYPNSAAALSDAPTYGSRTDDWVGRTSVLPVHHFEESAGISRIIAPDGSVSETKTIVATGIADRGMNGLVEETLLKASQAEGAPVLSHTRMKWEQGGTNGIPRLKKVWTTDETGETRAVVYDLYDDYNNVRVMTTHDFAAYPELGAELRRTETVYVTDQRWTNRRLVRLPLHSSVLANGATVRRVDYGYDETPLVRRGADPVTGHDQAFNPDAPEEWRCRPSPQCEPDDFDCGCRIETLYDPATDYRGNLTSVKTYSDAATPSAGTTVTNTAVYDILGNLTEQTVNCCRKKTFTYTDSYKFAYPETETRGEPPLQLSTKAVYDFNTGLVTSTKDENDQETTLYYNVETLRLARVVRPAGGGSTEYVHEEGLVNGPGNTPRYSRSSTKTYFESGRAVESLQYFDGRGAQVRSLHSYTSAQGWVTVDVEYDVMGRVLRTSNPYYSAGATAAINPTELWTTNSVIDKLGRVTEITLPDDTKVTNQFAGKVTTIGDQAGRQRRRISDALGRVIELHEPDASGSLGTVASPAQKTVYEYDALDNLTKVWQAGGYRNEASVTQERVFKYDSLSRLTHQRQVEETARLNDAGEVVEAGGQWSRVTKYDAWGNMTDAYDARGVHTHIEYDTLNRIDAITYSDGTPALDYTYDEARADAQGQPYANRGRLTKVATAAVADGAPATAQEYDYDRLGRTEAQRQKVGADTYALSYKYNLAGQLTEQLYPSGRIVKQAYDDAGRLLSAGNADGTQLYTSGLKYAAHGGLVSEASGNGTVAEMDYNSRLQLKDLTLKRNNTPSAEVIQRYVYQYGQVDQATGAVDAAKNAGQIGKVESYIGGTVATPTKQWEQRFSYDTLNRLAQVSERRADNGQAAWQSTYGYDRFGNRYQHPAENQNSLFYTPVEEADVDRATNRIVTPTPTTPGMEYDHAGRVTRDTKFRQKRYAYDANGRMTWAANLDDSGATTAVYDGLGQRVQTMYAGQPRTMVYDISGKVVAEYGAAEADGGGLRYVFMDQQGSTRAVLDAQGQVKARRDYAPFGEDVGAVGTRSGVPGYNGTDETRQQYAQTERDKETGLDHTWWRKYDNAAGRWTSPDPSNGSMNISEPQSFNRYAYVDNDPVNFIDPSGLLKAAPYNGGHLGDVTVIGHYDASISLTGGSVWDRPYSDHWGTDPFDTPDPYVPETDPVDPVDPQEPSKSSFTERTCGPFVVPHAATLENAQCIGTGDCVPLVQNPIEILGKQYPGLPHTSHWRQGDSVRHSRSPIEPGTVIATFDSNTGKYPTTNKAGYKHAAIYLGKDSTGIWVIEQFKPLEKIQKRHIEYNDKKTPSNNGNQFSVVLTNCKPRT
ncbi:MAG TPA: BPSL0067 family protein [Pyrinomonadaceae bacterium]